VARRGKDTARTKEQRLARESHEELIRRFRSVLADANKRPDREELAKILLDDALTHLPAMHRAFDDMLEERRLVKQQDMNVPTAMDVLRRDYVEDVDGLAKDLKRQIDEGEITDAEELSDRMHEAVDGTQRVIYTAQAQLGLVFSNNSSAYADEMGEEGLVRDGDVNWSGMMFMAMQQDVIEELERLGVDVNDPQPTEDEETE
jgi:hypothetical protein